MGIKADFHNTCIFPFRTPYSQIYLYKVQTKAQFASGLGRNLMLWLYRCIRKYLEPGLPLSPQNDGFKLLPMLCLRMLTHLYLRDLVISSKT